MNYLIERLARVIYFAPSIPCVGYKSFGPYGSDATWEADEEGRKQAIDQARNVIGNLMSRAEELEDREIEGIDEGIASGWRRLGEEIDKALLNCNQDPLASDLLGYSAKMAAINVDHSRPTVKFDASLSPSASTPSAT